MSRVKMTAEERFRSAFDRLKINAPIRLEKDTAVSQNNVAKEAGKNPTALRKLRHPKLVKDIQDWIAERDLSQVKKRETKKKRNQEILESDAIIERVLRERDLAQCELVSAHRQLLELLEQNAQLQRRLDELMPPLTHLKRNK